MLKLCKQTLALLKARPTTVSFMCLLADVPTGRLLSWFGVAEAATSVTVSHNGEYIATSHVDSLGICLWVNRTLYANVSINAVSPGARPVAKRLLFWVFWLRRKSCPETMSLTTP